MSGKYLSPLWWAHFLRETRYLHFFSVGMSGVLLNLAITAFFTELVFGRENYFSAYLIGLTVNLLYNFALHTLVTFKTKGHHAKRMVAFFAYSISLAYIQAQVVRIVTSWVGVDWYLVVIATVILSFSAVTFLLFKFILFRNRPDIEGVAP